VPLFQIFNRNPQRAQIRNPSGMCCLGEVNKAIKRLTIESAAIQISGGK
jgi:hypothetical protein